MYIHIRAYFSRRQLPDIEQPPELVAGLPHDPFRIDMAIIGYLLDVNFYNVRVKTSSFLHLFSPDIRGFAFPIAFNQRIEGRPSSSTSDSRRSPCGMDHYLPRYRSRK